MRKMNRNAGLAAGARKLLGSCSGQSLIEWAMIVPLAFFLIVNVVNYGALAYAAITVSNAARAGAAYMQQGPQSLNVMGYPTTAQVTSVVQTDMSALPRYTTATVNVCSNKSGSADASTGYTCLTPIYSGSTNYADPEPTTSEIGTVQVTYTYCPLIPSFNFSALGLGTFMPSCTRNGNGDVTGGGTTITRVAAMRLLQ